MRASRCSHPPGERAGCGACELVCPVETIFYQDDTPEQGARFTSGNATFASSSARPAARPRPARCSATPAVASFVSGQ